MNISLMNLLITWPKAYITSTDIMNFLNCSDDARYGIIKRAIKNKLLIKLRRDLYLIGKPYKNVLPNLFEIAQSIHGPSHISLESALSYHSWIPEAVYTITSVTTKRSMQFATPIGQFNYMRVPVKEFYLGVERVVDKEDIFFIANPWRALADYIYVYKKTWKNLTEINLDLRIEIETMLDSDKSLLRILSERYPNVNVRKLLLFILQELMHYESKHHH